MKITKAIEKRINAACRRELGGKRVVEIGERASSEDSTGMNFLLWDDESDLIDTHDVCTVSEVTETEDGFVALDCYCYFPPGHDYECDLDDNVYLLIDASGKIVYEGCVGNRDYMERIEAIMSKARAV